MDYILLIAPLKVSLLFGSDKMYFLDVAGCMREGQSPSPVISARRSLPTRAHCTSTSAVLMASRILTAIVKCLIPASIGMISQNRLKT